MNFHRNPIWIMALILCSSFIASAQQSNPTPTSSTTPSPLPELKVKGLAVYSGRGAWCPSPTPSRPTQSQEAVAVPTPTRPHELCIAGIGDRVIVEVDGLKEAEKNGAINSGDLVLFLNGRPLKGVNAVPVDDPEANWLAFDLIRTDDSSQAWSALLTSPGFQRYREEKVSVGFADKPALPFSDRNNPPKIGLRLYHRGWAIGSLIGLLLTLVLFWRLAKTTGVIRDSGPPLLPPTTRPYSLSRAQAAFWFFLVIGSFIFLYLITGDYNTITDQALILMGIGTGTALGAAMIDATKDSTANKALNDLTPQRARLATEVTELAAKEAALSTLVTNAGVGVAAEDKQSLSTTRAELSEKQAQLAETDKKIADASSGLSKPASEGFGRDLLTDANGVNFHRFQMVIWTIVLGFLFCVGVYTTLAMPQFSGTLLALMGISSGTYLGFKIPERQN